MRLTLAVHNWINKYAINNLAWLLYVVITYLSRVHLLSLLMMEIELKKAEKHKVILLIVTKYE